MNGKTPMLTIGIVRCPTEKGFFLFEEGKVFLLLQDNFFLDARCYISLFPLFPSYIYRKIIGRFLAGYRSIRQSGHKIQAAEKKIRPLLLNCIFLILTIYGPMILMCPCIIDFIGGNGLQG